MSSKTKLDMKIKTTMSYSYNSNKEQQLNITYLNFQDDKQITFSGSDNQGEFNISGQCEGDFIVLKREQKGKLNNYYVGRLENNKIYLCFDTIVDNLQKIQRLNNMEFNALIELNLEDLKKFCEGPTKDKWTSLIKKVDFNTFKSIEMRRSLSDLGGKTFLNIF
jgi:hypothetical protein